MKIKIWLIRHGMTAGNRQQRYVGTTDELLCEEGRQQIILKRQLIKSDQDIQNDAVILHCQNSMSDIRCKQAQVSCCQFLCGIPEGISTGS